MLSLVIVLIVGHTFRASANFQVLEVLNFLPLKFRSENFRKFHLDMWLYCSSSICILIVIFSGHLQQNIHEFIVIVAFMGIFIILTIKVAFPPLAVRVKIIYPAEGWITSYWPVKENKYDHVSWHTVASEWDLIQHILLPNPKYTKIQSTQCLQNTRPTNINSPVQLDFTNPT